MGDPYKAAFATSIFVNGSSVYVSGFKTERVYFEDFSPVYWSNGTVNWLPYNSNPKPAGPANSIFVENSVLYTAGSVTTGGSDNAVLWRTNTPTALPQMNIAKSVFVQHRKIFVAGTGDKHARLWVYDPTSGGAGITLNLTSESKSSEANSVYVIKK